MSDKCKQCEAAAAEVPGREYLAGGAPIPFAVWREARIIEIAEHRARNAQRSLVETLLSLDVRRCLVCQEVLP